MNCIDSVLERFKNGELQTENEWMQVFATLTYFESLGQRSLPSEVRYQFLQNVLDY